MKPDSRSDPRSDPRSSLRPGYAVAPQVLEALGLGDSTLAVRSIHLDVDASSCPRATIEAYATPEQIVAFAELIKAHGITNVRFEPWPATSGASAPKPAPVSAPVSAPASKQITNGQPLIVEGLEYYRPTYVIADGNSYRYVYRFLGRDNPLGAEREVAIKHETVEHLGLDLDYDTAIAIVRHRVARELEAQCLELFGKGKLVAVGSKLDTTYRWVTPTNALPDDGVVANGFAPGPATVAEIAPETGPATVAAKPKKSSIEQAVQYILDCLEAEARAQQVK